MLGRLGRFVVLAGAVEGARRFVKANPQVAGKIAAQGAGLVDQVTKGRFHNQIDAVVHKLEGGDAPGSDQPTRGPDGPDPALGAHTI